MSIRDYLIKKIKTSETFCLAVILIFFPLSETVKQVFFLTLLFLFSVNKLIVREIQFDQFSKGLIIFLASNLFPILLSSEPHLASKWAYNVFMYSSVYLFLINDFRSENNLNLIRKSFISGLILGLLWGIVVWKLYWGKPRLEILSVGAPNSTGTYLGICVILIVTLFCQGLKELYRQNLKLLILYVILFGTLIVSLVLNGSRGMYVGLLCCLFYLGIYFFVKQKKLIFLWIFIIVLFNLIMGAILYPELSGRILDTFSFFDRLNNNWNKGLLCFTVNPITGGGDKTCYEDPDNLLIAILTRSGIIGFFGFFYLLYSYMRQFKKNKYAVALLIFILVNGIFETSLKYESALAFVVTLHILNNSYNENTDSQFT